MQQFCILGLGKIGVVFSVEDRRMGCRKSKWRKDLRQAGFFPNYCQHQESCTSLVDQHTKEMSKQHGQLLVSRKLIYQYPERLESFLFTALGSVPVQHRPAWAPRVTGCPCSAQAMQSCRVLGSLCLGTISCESGNKGDNHRKKLLSFRISGVRN